MKRYATDINPTTEGPDGCMILDPTEELKNMAVCAVCGGETNSGNIEYHKSCYFATRPHEVGNLRTTTYGEYYKPLFQRRLHV